MAARALRMHRANNDFNRQITKTNQESTNNNKNSVLAVSTIMILTKATIAGKAGKTAVLKQTANDFDIGKQSNDIANNNNNKTEQRTKTTRRNVNIHRKIRSTIWPWSDWNVGNILLLFCLLMAVGKENSAAVLASVEVTSATNGVRPMASLSMQLRKAPLTAVVSDDEGRFRPIIPEDLSPEFIAQNVFTKSGHYRIFQNVESDLRMVVPVKRKDYVEDCNSSEGEAKDSQRFTRGIIPTTTDIAPSTDVTATEATLSESTKLTMSVHDADDSLLKEVQSPADELSGDDFKEEKLQPTQEMDGQKHVVNENNISLDNELRGLEDLLINYVQNFSVKGMYKPMPGLVLALKRNHNSDFTQQNEEGKKTPYENRLRRHLRPSFQDANVSLNLPRAVQSGRFLFFTGLKKIMWPIYMGLQVLKSLLFALFLPTIIGSVSKLIGKGITSGSASSVPLFVRPMEAPQELDFRDANFSFDDEKFTINTDDDKDNYNQAASQTQPQYTPYNAAAINQQALDRQHQHLMQDTYLSALQSIGAASFKNSQGISSGSLGGGGGGGTSLSRKPAALANMNTFQTFQKVPATSLLLSNYDPFYSPLLSRLDSVFAQLKLNSENEICREKLICLMYANPAKYAPYSNLVSAQLSRELNELRKPTSDNPDILRFFKYMRAAKDGQDGIDCEESFAKCQEFKDFENPAMLSTYNDINKLVQARNI